MNIKVHPIWAVAIAGEALVALAISSSAPVGCTLDVLAGVGGFFMVVDAIVLAIIVACTEQ